MSWWEKVRKRRQEQAVDDKTEEARGKRDRLEEMRRRRREDFDRFMKMEMSRKQFEQRQLERQNEQERLGPEANLGEHVDEASR